MNGSLGKPDASLEHSPKDSYCAIDIETEAPIEHLVSQTLDTYESHVLGQPISSSDIAASSVAAGAECAVGTSPPIESSTAS